MQPCEGCLELQKYKKCTGCPWKRIFTQEEKAK